MKVTPLRLFPKRRLKKSRDWNNQDIADFYRAMDILKKAGLDTEADSGISDEGDPWFVFLRPEDMGSYAVDDWRGVGEFG